MWRFRAPPEAPTTAGRGTDHGDGLREADAAGAADAGADGQGPGGSSPARLSRLPRAEEWSRSKRLEPLEITEITISPELIDPNEPELLADTVLAAVNEASAPPSSSSRAKLGGAMGGMQGLGSPRSVSDGCPRPPTQKPALRRLRRREARAARRSLHGGGVPGRSGADRVADAGRGDVRDLRRHSGCRGLWAPAGARARRGRRRDLSSRTMACDGPASSRKAPCAASHSAAPSSSRCSKRSPSWPRRCASSHASGLPSSRAPAERSGVTTSRIGRIGRWSHRRSTTSSRS